MEHPTEHPQVGRGCLALFLAFSLVYGAAAPDVYVGGDHAIFAAAAASGGYAFPPGYPLYTMLLRLGGAILPASNLIHAYDLFTGLLGAGAVAALFAALRWWRVPAPSSLFAAALFGVSGHALAVHSQSEVFSLNGLLVALILGLCGPDAPLRGRRRVLALGLLAGLALSHNHTCVLIAPVGLYGAWLGAREARPEQGARGVLLEVPGGALALAAGLLPYLYLPLVSATSPGSWRWSDVRSLDDLLATFFRRDYGSMRLTVQSGDATPADQILFLIAEVSRDLAYLPIVLAVVGALAAWRLLPPDTAGADDATEDAPRAPWVALGASLLLCGPAFVSLVDVDPHQGLYYLLVRKFHVLPTLVLSFFVARGAARARAAVRPGLAASVAAALLLAASALATESLTLTRTHAVDALLRDLTAQLPPDAVLFVTGDHLSGGLAYLQHGEGVRPDVSVVSAKLLSGRWYVDRVREQEGLSLPFQGTDIDLSEVFDAVHATGRPVFLTDPLTPDLAARMVTYPDGLTIRVLPPGQAPPPPMQVLASMDARYAAFTHTPDLDADPRSWAYHVNGQYARAWLTLASAARGAGATALAEQLDARAAEWRAPEER
jgi:hypothetical protein